MVKTINKVAVIGSGVMGSAIAAHVANAGIPVLLYDIVPAGASLRNILASNAISKMLKSEPQAFVHEGKADLIEACNLEDDLAKLADVDWIIEAIVEKKEAKQDLYKKIADYRQQGSIVSSNTSTITIANLIAGREQDFRRHFCITHFFNPPRYMRLLELVTGADTDQEAVNALSEFIRVKLGKGIVKCKDTPGFIANRIGCFWLYAGIKAALDLKIKIEHADQIMGKPAGIPRTGIFGLADLIGIDVLELIAQSFLQSLPVDDLFRHIYAKHQLMQKLLQENLIGRKSRGGFYRMVTDNGKKKKQVIDLSSGEYVDEQILPPEIINIDSVKLKTLLTHESVYGRYACQVWSTVLSYAASLIPEIADDIYSVDEAMRLGFNWRYGPFELIDQLGEGEITGANWLVGQISNYNLPVPDLIKRLGNKQFYDKQGDKLHYFGAGGGYKELPVRHDEWQLAGIKSRETALVYSNQAVALWDVGDDIACIEFKTKMNSLNNDIFNAISDVFPIIGGKFQALLIGNDADNFCVGADLRFVLEKIEQGAWFELDNFIRNGQQVMSHIKYAPFPVVAALRGMALGGGAELVLHASGVQAFVESYTGLVEIGVGLIPGWGGCKEMISKSYHTGDNSEIIKAFTNILSAAVSKSADKACEMLHLKQCHITMNRQILLNDAKNLAKNLARNYQLKQVNDVEGSKITGIKDKLREVIDTSKLSPHDLVIANKLLEIFCLPANATVSENNLLDMERNIFLELAKTKATKERIEFMLKHNKPLKN